MKNIKSKLVFVLVFLLTFSCGEPETTVTDIIHPDGSITRQIEIRSLSNDFDPSDIQVPYDSTWSIIRDTIEVENGKDTTWIRIAEKDFREAAEITRHYNNNNDVNSKTDRSAGFIKNFRWFFTIMKFSERIENNFSYGYPVSDYLSEEELEFFYLPDNISEERKHGPDSTRYKDMNESIEKKSERWVSMSLISEWIEEFLVVMGDRARGDLSRDSLKLKEEAVSKFVLNASDSLIFATLVGSDNLEKFSNEVDSANNNIERKFDIQFSFVKYNMKFIMPGKVIATNGFIDSSGVITWPVKADYFLTTPYEMWAESKTTNPWTWIVSGLFLLFVIAGLIMRRFGKSHV